jgi:tripartite-type tricarboxylate transporter receptor subunit TctC
LHSFLEKWETEEVKQVLNRLSYPHDIKESEELTQIIKKDYELMVSSSRILGLESIRNNGKPEREGKI